MTKIIAEQIAKPSKYFFWILSFFCVIQVSVYFYSIAQITVSVRKNTVLEDKLSSLNLETSNLEYQYLQSKNLVTLDVAKNMGFSENTKQIFVSRTTDAPSLSLNVNEI